MAATSSYPLTSRDPAEIIAFHTGREIPVGQLLATASRLASRLPDHEYVINLFSNRYHFLLGFCASTIAGQCTLLPPNKLDNTMQLLSRDYPDLYTIGNPGPGYFDMPEGESIEFPEHGAARVRTPEIPGDQVCAIAFTSGSTGRPAPNRKSWRTLRGGAISNAGMLGPGISDRMNLLATVPAQHMWGFETSVMLPLFSNTAASDELPFFPQDIADALSRLPAPRALVSSPVHLDALLKSAVRLPGLDRIFSATAPLSRDQAKALEARYGAEVLEVFGCSESGIIATRKAATQALWTLSDDMELSVTEGATRVRGRHLPDEIELPDLVELAQDRTFRWLGRQQDMVKIAGKRCSLADLNRKLSAIAGVDDGVIFMPPGESVRLAALVVAPRLRCGAILEALKPLVDPVFLPRPVFLVERLPRQETGKLAQSAVLELFERTRNDIAQGDNLRLDRQRELTRSKET